MRGRLACPWRRAWACGLLDRIYPRRPTCPVAKSVEIDGAQRERQEVEYQLEVAARTLKVNRLTCVIGIIVLTMFMFLDQPVLGIGDMVWVRLSGIVPLCVILIISFTLLPGRPHLVVPLHIGSLTALMVQGCLLCYSVFNTRPDTEGWQTGATGALFISILGVFVMAGGGRRFLLLIIGAPLALLLTAFATNMVLSPHEFALFIDPVVAAGVTVAMGLVQEGITRREFSMRWLARLHKEELEAEVAKHRRTAYRLQRQSLELRTSNDELDQFANTVSHDLREPLRVVSGFLGLIHGQLRKDEPDLHKLHTYIGESLDSASRMDRLISDLLAFARVGTRGHTFHTVDLDRVLADALKGLAVAIAESGAEIQLEGKLPTVLGDRSQLLQLFQNLISNAVKYRRPDQAPRIQISGERDKSGMARISVRDDGIGIPKQFHQEIFDVFRRLHTRDEYQGTGMGLAICKKIVDRHGGDLTVLSEEGQGTTFIVELAARPTALDRAQV